MIKIVTHVLYIFRRDELFLIISMFSSLLRNKVNQIMCCIAWRPDWADDVIRIAQERRNDAPCAIVGVDIAAGEEHFDKVQSGKATQHHCSLLLILSVYSYDFCFYVSLGKLSTFI
jgi:hypothetical protein